MTERKKGGKEGRRGRNCHRHSLRSRPLPSPCGEAPQRGTKRRGKGHPPCCLDPLITRSKKTKSSTALSPPPSSHRRTFLGERGGEKEGGARAVLPHTFFYFEGGFIYHDRKEDSSAVPPIFHLPTTSNLRRKGRKKGRRTLSYFTNLIS